MNLKRHTHDQPQSKLRASLIAQNFQSVERTLSGWRRTEIVVWPMVRELNLSPGASIVSVQRMPFGWMRSTHRKKAIAHRAEVMKTQNGLRKDVIV